MDPTLSRCLQGGRGELGLALSPSGERQELSAGRKKHSQDDSGVGEGFPSSRSKFLGHHRQEVGIGTRFFSDCPSGQRSLSVGAADDYDFSFPIIP